MKSDSITVKWEGKGLYTKDLLKICSPNMTIFDQDLWDKIVGAASDEVSKPYIVYAETLARLTEWLVKELPGYELRRLFPVADALVSAVVGYHCHLREVSLLLHETWVHGNELYNYYLQTAQNQDLDISEMLNNILLANNRRKEFDNYLDVMHTITLKMHIYFNADYWGVQFLIMCDQKKKNSGSRYWDVNGLNARARSHHDKSIKEEP
ncbi:MAG: hypothetical protein WCI79_02715 [Candidatus Saccharibacteria bacterium]